MKKKLIFKIDMENGHVDLEAVGFTGSSCKDATRPFEEALGFVPDRTTKPIYWNSSVSDEQRIKVNGQ